jgi:hypothetical protein
VTLSDRHRAPPGLLSEVTVVKQLRREADHSRLSGAEVKNEWSYPSFPPYSLLNTTGTTFTKYQFSTAAAFFDGSSQNARQTNIVITLTSLFLVHVSVYLPVHTSHTAVFIRHYQIQR